MSIPNGFIYGSEFEENHHKEIDAEIKKRMAQTDSATYKSPWFPVNFRAGIRYAISLFEPKIDELAALRTENERLKKDVKDLEECDDIANVTFEIMKAKEKALTASHRELVEFVKHFRRVCIDEDMTGEIPDIDAALLRAEAIIKGTEQPPQEPPRQE